MRDFVAKPSNVCFLLQTKLQTLLIEIHEILSPVHIKLIDSNDFSINPVVPNRAVFELFLQGRGHVGHLCFTHVRIVVIQLQIDQ